MAQIRAGESPARVAVTGIVQGSFVLPIDTVKEFYFPTLSKGAAIASIARRQYAVKHVYPMFNRIEDVRRRTYTHEVARFIPRKFFHGVTQYFIHKIPAFSHT